MPLKNHSTHPPGGFSYYQPATGWRLASGLPFTNATQAIQKHHAANPGKGLPTDYEGCAKLLDEFTCARLGNDDEYCDSGEKKTSFAMELPASGPKARGARLVRGLLEKLEAAPVLADWLGDGMEPVEQELADARSSICRRCPLNLEGNWLDRITGGIADLIRDQMSAKNSLALHVDGEDALHTCDACGCDLKLKVWVPLKHIKAAGEADYHPLCWIRSETA